MLENIMQNQDEVFFQQVQVKYTSKSLMGNDCFLAQTWKRMC